MRKDNDLGKAAWKSISPMSPWMKMAIIGGLILLAWTIESNLGDYTAKYQKQQANNVMNLH